MMPNWGFQEILTLLLMILYPVAWGVVVYAIYRALNRIKNDRR